MKSQIPLTWFIYFLDPSRVILRDFEIYHFRVPSPTLNKVTRTADEIFETFADQYFLWTHVDVERGTTAVLSAPIRGEAARSQPQESCSY
jgi:coproporphyrinogen III oxidase